MGGGSGEGGIGGLDLREFHNRTLLSQNRMSHLRE